MSKLVIGNDKPYRKHPGINQSKLQAFATSISEYRSYMQIGMSPKQIEDEQNKVHFRKGLAVDCKLLTPANWAKEFVIVPEIKKDNAVYILLEAWLEAGNQDWDTEAMEVFSRTVKYQKANETKIGLWAQNKWTSAKKNTEKNPTANEDEVLVRIKARQAKFDTADAKKLFATLRSFSGKTPIYPTELKEIEDACVALKRDSPEIFVKNDEQDRYFQLDYYFDYMLPNGTKCTFKILLDFVLVDHKNKRVQPGDLKTTSKSAAEEFPKSYINYGYYRQASLYHYGIRLWMNENGMADYELLPFLFVVKSLTLKSESTMVWEVPEDFNAVGRYGGNFNWNKVAGWEKEAADLLEFNATEQYYESVEQIANRKAGKPNSLNGYITAVGSKLMNSETVEIVPLADMIESIDFLDGED